MIRASRTMAAVLLWVAAMVPSAQAGEAIELGGKKSVSMLAAVNAESQFASAILVGSLDFSYITLSARYEAGLGVRAVGLLAGPAVLAAYFPYVTGRINSNLFGAEENMLLYIGGNLGVSIFTIDVDEDDERAYAFAGGPRFGYEYYVNPHIAIRVDNTVTIGKGIEDSIAVSNTFSIGARLLF